MDEKYLAQAIESCGGDVEAAIAHLTKLQITAGEAASDNNFSKNKEAQAKDEEDQKSARVFVDRTAGSNGQADKQVPSGEQWVDLILQEMAAAKNIDEARERARRILQAVEDAIVQRSASRSSEKVAEVERENHILKRAVAIQNTKLKEALNRELQAQQALQEQSAKVRSLELTNYSLALHLKQATGGSDLPANHHPDVF